MNPSAPKGCPGDLLGFCRGTLFQVCCLHKAYGGETGEKHHWGTEEMDSFSQALGSTVLQLSQRKAQETPEREGSQAVTGGVVGP